MKKKRNFESIITMLCSLILIFPWSAQATDTKMHIFLGDQKLATIEDEKIYFNLNDHLGSPTIVTNKDGTIVEQNDYNDFGQLVYASSTINNDYKFSGKEQDEENKLQYFVNRYYDNHLGRFASIDPLLLIQPAKFLSDPQQLNSYSYARNNPISLIDPLGLSSATFNDIPEGGWKLGDNMGQFNGVDAYYNGIGSFRMNNSCVEYAKRYMSNTYGINNMGVVGDPKGMWSNIDSINRNLDAAGSSYNFVQHRNGKGFNLPGEGDLLIWTQGTYGHVMVVTEANFDNTTNTGYVEIMDQNASQKSLRTYNINKTGDGYSIMKNKTTPMAGWLSPVHKNNSNTMSNNYATPSLAPRASFFQRAWNSTKSFFNSIF